MKPSSQSQIHQIIRRIFLKTWCHIHSLYCSSDSHQPISNVQDREWHITDSATGRSVCLASDRELQDWLIANR
jgi:hypothetical protein